MSQRFARHLLGALAIAGLGLALPQSAAALEQKLTVADGAAGDAFGDSVAVDGDTIAVGAPGEKAGAVYLYTRSGDSWIQTAKLTASDGASGDALGLSVAIDGDTIVAGAPEDDFGTASDRGSAYTFARTGAAARTETGKLVASDADAGDRLGISVAIDGDTIVAGAYGDDIGLAPNTDQGSAYTFARTGATPTRPETAKLTATDGASDDRLGYSVAIDGDTIVAGSTGANVNQAGAAYTFARSGTPSRSQTAKLTASDGATGDLLGYSVAIQGDTIVAGAESDQVGSTKFQGSVYTYDRTGATARTETAKLTASDGGEDDLGEAVGLDGDTIIAGADFDDVGANKDQGSAYTFARTGAAARTETGKLTDADGGESDEFGESAAISGDTILIGAWDDDVGANKDQGSATIFFSPGPVQAAGSALDVAGPGDIVVSPPLARASVSGFDFSPDVIAVGRRATAISAVAKGGRFKFVLSAAARVSIAIDRKLPGRRLGRRCVRPRPGLRRRCARYERRGTLLRSGKAGPNTVPFTGRIGTRALSPGRYRATIRATNPAGVSVARTTTFRVVRAPR